MDFEYAGLALIPIIIGLVEVMKKLGMPDKLAAIPSLILGLAAGIFYISPGDVKTGIVTGIFMGLSASGLYSGVKSGIEAIKGK
jgi:hypothetical protein